MRIVVVGAGVFGVTAALELRRRGHAVQLVDRAPLPAPNPNGSSVDRSRAVRLDYGADRFYIDQAAAARAQWRQWNDRFGQSVYAETGFLFAAAASLDGASFEADSFRMLHERGEPVERLHRTDVEKRFPMIAATEWVDGYLNPAAGFARAGRVVELLLVEAAAAGVELVPNASIASLGDAPAPVTGVDLRDGRRLAADAVVLATGAFTPALLPAMSPVLDANAQTVLWLRPDDPRPFAECLPIWAWDIGGLGWYGFPAVDGLVKVAHHGSGIRRAPGDHTPDPGLEARAREFLARHIPALATAELVEQRVCFYCDSLDGDFWITAVPERPGLFVAAGGSGHGFKFAPLLGGWIADAVEGRGSPALGRFAWRDPTAGREAARSTR